MIRGIVSFFFFFLSAYGKAWLNVQKIILFYFERESEGPSGVGREEVGERILACSAPSMEHKPSAGLEITTLKS